MGRPEKPLAGTGPVTEFAGALRELRRRAGLTYRDMAERTHQASSALSQAASGSTLPSWELTEAYLRACGEVSIDQWRRRWSAAAAERAAMAPSPITAIDFGTTASTATFIHHMEPAGLHDLLQEMRLQAGNPTLRELSLRSRLPKSSLADMFHGRVPRRESLMRLIDACAPPEDLRAKVLTAWETAVLDRQAIQSSPQNSAPIRTLPPTTTTFVGRDGELADLLSRTSGSRTAPAISVIGGMAGIGKTALALHAAHLAADYFPDGQLYLNFHAHHPNTGPEDPGTVLERALCVLGDEREFLPPDLDVRTALFRSRLAGTRTLLVLDDVDSEEQVRPLIPAEGSCRVLITSRRQLHGLADADSLTLDVLSPTDAVTLLGRVSERDPASDPEAFEDIARSSGYLPLALCLAAGRLRSRPSWSPGDLVKSIKDSLNSLDESDPLVGPIRKALENSYAQLSPQHQEVFQYAGLHPSPEFDSYAMAAFADVDPLSMRRALEDLVDRSLLTQPSPDRYRLHELVRQFAADRARREVSTEKIDDAERRLTDYYRHTAGAAYQQMVTSQTEGQASTR
jgi:hypothetical protein